MTTYDHLPRKAADAAYLLSVRRRDYKQLRRRGWPVATARDEANARYSGGVAILAIHAASGARLDPMMLIARANQFVEDGEV